MFSQFQIYGIPIPMHNMLHVKLGIGDIGVYGRSDLASTIGDFEILEQIVRLFFKQGLFDGPAGWKFCLLSGLYEWVLADRHRRFWRESESKLQ